MSLRYRLFKHGIRSDWGTGLSLGLRDPPGGGYGFFLRVIVVVLGLDADRVIRGGGLFSSRFGSAKRQCQSLSLRYRLFKLRVRSDWGVGLSFGLRRPPGGGYGFFLQVAVIILKLDVDRVTCGGALFSSRFGSAVGQSLLLRCSCFDVSIRGCGAFQ